MQPFRYHDAQRAVQREANSVPCADKLSTWVGPVAEFTAIADLIVLAALADTTIRIGVVSGPAPLATARETGDEIIVELPRQLLDLLPTAGRCGGIVINPALARRSRLSGVLDNAGNHVELRCGLAFTNCRKYITPTASAGPATHVGPTAARPIPLADPWVEHTAAQGETAFLVTTTPDGGVDVSHRGGRPGFLHFEPATGSIRWTEYLGDGMFVSTGNLRASHRFALLVLDFDTGDALRLDGVAEYTNVRSDRKARVDALIQAGEPFPVQGHIVGRVHAAERLRAFCLPRVRVPARSRITSTDTTEVQHPQ